MSSGDVVVRQVQVGPVVAALAFQLLLHVGDDVVLFGVNGHDAAVFADLLEDLPQVPHRDAGVEGGEDLEARDAGLDRLADFAHGAGRDGAGQDVVEGVVGVGVAAEGIPARLDLGHDGIGRRHRARCQGQRPGEVNVGGDASEGSGAAGGLGRLGEHAVVSAGPIVGHRDVDVGMRLDAAGQYDHAGGIDGLAGPDVVEDTGSGHRRDLLALDAHVPQANAVRCDHGPALDDQVQHDCLPNARVVSIDDGELYASRPSWPRL